MQNAFLLSCQHSAIKLGDGIPTNAPQRRYKPRGCIASRSNPRLSRKRLSFTPWISNESGPLTSRELTRLLRAQGVDNWVGRRCVGDLGEWDAHCGQEEHGPDGPDGPHVWEELHDGGDARVGGIKFWVWGSGVRNVKRVTARSCVV